MKNTAWVIDSAAHLLVNSNFRCYFIPIKNLVLFLFFTCLLAICPVRVSSQNDYFRNINSSLGLSQNSVVGIALDSSGQQIAAIAYQASVLEVKINEVDSNITSKFSGLAASVALQTQNLVVNIKQLSKVLLPFELETNGLISALQTLATRMNTTYHIDCEFTSNIGEEDIDSVVALNIYRVAQEAVNNAIFHGKAKHVSIALNADNSEPNRQVVHLAVCDNGSGFSESFLEQNLLTGMGIKIMHYRAKQLDGQLKILRRNESGVEVHFIIPIKEHDQQI